MDSKENEFSQIWLEVLKLGLGTEKSVDIELALLKKWLNASAISKESFIITLFIRMKLACFLDEKLVKLLILSQNTWR